MHRGMSLFTVPFCTVCYRIFMLPGLQMHLSQYQSTSCRVACWLASHSSKLILGLKVKHSKKMLSQNHWGWKRPLSSPTPLLSQNRVRWSRLLLAMSSHIYAISKDDDSTAPLNNLFPCSTTPMTKVSFLLFENRLNNPISQPLLTCQTLQPLHQLHGLSLDSFQYVHVVLVQGSPEPDRALQRSLTRAEE